MYEAREAIRREGSVFLVEGYMMCWRCMRRVQAYGGVVRDGALYGAYCFVETIYTTSVRVMLMPDKAGRKAADAVVPTLAGRRRDGGGEDRAAGRGRSGLALRRLERGVCRLRPWCGRPGLRKNSAARTHPKGIGLFVRCGGSGETGTLVTGCWRIA
ncbi:MAG: hypothetical protein ACLR6J_14020 [Parabacteroides merdae]